MYKSYDLIKKLEPKIGEEEAKELLARPLAATKFEIRISKYETISNDKKLNAPNFK